MSDNVLMMVYHGYSEELLLEGLPQFRESKHVLFPWCFPRMSYITCVLGMLGHFGTDQQVLVVVGCNQPLAKLCVCLCVSPLGCQMSSDDLWS